jgi:membrane protein DedA with SNARE-associated domain
VIITALAADLAGAGILYLVFYTSGTFLMRKKPSWLHVSEQRVKKIREKISNRGRLNIFLFRLVSMTRVYAAIISGLLHLNLRIYIPSVIMAAVTWTSFYASLGFILGPSSKRIFSDPRYFKVFLFSIVLIVISISVFVWLRNKYVNKKKETSGFNSSGI